VEAVIVKEHEAYGWSLAISEEEIGSTSKQTGTMPQSLPYWVVLKEISRYVLNSHKNRMCLSMSDHVAPESQPGVRQAILTDPVVSKNDETFLTGIAGSLALLVGGAGDDVASKSVGINGGIQPTLVRMFECLSLFETLWWTIEGSKWLEYS
jgi:hypothetical protein